MDRKMVLITGEANGGDTANLGTDAAVGMGQVAAGPGEQAIVDGMMTVLGALAPALDGDLEVTHIRLTSGTDAGELASRIATTEAVIATDPSLPAIRMLRRSLDLFSVIRPVHLFPSLRTSSSLKPEFLSDVDITLVGEGTGGIVFGAHGREMVSGAGADCGVGPSAFDALDYDEREISRIVRSAFEMARSRGRVLHSIDAADRLETSRLWREVVDSMRCEYEDVDCIDMSYEDALYALTTAPCQFDTMLADSLMVDLLTATASSLAVSPSMIPSAYLGPSHSLYGPALVSPMLFGGGDGSGPTNPISLILALGMCLNYSFNRPDLEGVVLRSVNRVLEAGYRTSDIATEDTDAGMLVGPGTCSDLIAEQVMSCLN